MCLGSKSNITPSANCVNISIFFWSVFSGIRTEYSNLLCKSPYWDQIRETKDQINPAIPLIYLLGKLKTAKLIIIFQNSKTSKAAAKRYSEKKVFLKNFAKFTGKHLCRSLFLFKLQTAWDSSTGVFRWILRNFYKQLLYITPPGDSFWNSFLNFRNLAHWYFLFIF